MTFRRRSHIGRLRGLKSAMLMGMATCGAAACSSESPEEEDPVTGHNPGRETGYPDAMGGSAGELLPLGEPCIPASEKSPDYAGASLQGVALDTAAECGAAQCISNHFQGRVTCPYGQNLDSVSTLPNDDPARCRLPESEEGVEVAVPPQLMDRPPEGAVYCSCRCDGPDVDAEYCTCPEGMHCAELIEDTGTNPGAAGSYCVLDGTDYDETASYGSPCAASNPDSTEVCGEGNP